MKTSKNISSVEFDEKFDSTDVAEHFDLRSIKARYPSQRITIDFPKQVLESVDLAAAKIGVTRTALIKIWIAEKLAS